MRWVLVPWLVFGALGCGRTGLETTPREPGAAPACVAPPLPNRPLCDPDGWCAVLGPIPELRPILIDGSGPDDVWVTSADRLRHWAGARWTEYPAPTSTLQALHVIAPGDAWVGGADWLGRTALAHWDGQAWHSIPTPVGSAARDIAGADQDLWVAADDELFHFDGGNWSRTEVPAGASVTGLWAVSSQDVWAVGSRADVGRATVMHFDGDEWTELDTSSAPGPGQLLGAWGATADDVWLYGRGVLFRRHEGRLETWPASGVFTAMWGAKADDVWALADGRGAAAMLMHFDGSTWAEASAAPAIATRGTMARAGLWGSGRELWVAGPGDPMHDIAPTLHRRDGAGWHDARAEVLANDRIATVISADGRPHAFAGRGFWGGSPGGWTFQELGTSLEQAAGTRGHGWWACGGQNLVRGIGSAVIDRPLPTSCRQLWASGDEAWIALADDGLAVATTDGIRRMQVPMSRITMLFGDSLEHLWMADGATGLLRRSPGTGPLGSVAWEKVPVPTSVLTGVSFGGFDTWISDTNSFYRRGIDPVWVEQFSMPAPRLLGGTSPDHLWAAGDGLWVGNRDGVWRQVSHRPRITAVASCGDDPGWLVSDGELWQYAPENP